MSLTFKEVCDLKVGQKVEEYCYGVKVSFVVSNEPVITTENFGDKDHRQVTVLLAPGGEKQEAIEILITEGMEHYGPRLYLSVDGAPDIYAN